MFVLPLFRTLTHLFSGTASTLDGLLDTRRRWADRLGSSAPPLPADALASGGVGANPSEHVLRLLEEAQLEIERLHEENQALFDRLESVVDHFAEEEKKSTEERKEKF